MLVPLHTSWSPLFVLGATSECWSLSLVVIISTKQEAAHTQSAKVSTCYTLGHFGDWSLITWRGGGVKFYPYKRKGGGTKSCEVVLTWELEILAIVIKGGGAQKVATL